MKIVIFAGGTGRRLWPISRKHSPKQFEAIVGDKSTVQMAVERVLAAFATEDIYLATNEQYLDILRRQLPVLPESHFIGEPSRRDLAAAVGLAVIHLAHSFPPAEPMAIIWGDNTMTQADAFVRLLRVAGRIVMARRAEIVFIGETPRFANDNLGWIGLGDRLGEQDGEDYYAFKSWVYRPSLEECRQMFAEGKSVWNTGYFVTTIGFVSQAYRAHQPEMWATLQQIDAAIGSDRYQAVLAATYPQLRIAHFDDAIIRNLSLEQAVVLHGRMGWSDPGTWYALKEAVEPDTEANLTKGLVTAMDSRDCLLYNYEDGKLLAVVGLEGMVVVNTKDAILVVHKDDIPRVKAMVDGFDRTELERYS